MKHNPNYFNLPPYLSLAWNQVTALHCQNGALIITLNSGNTITLQDLDVTLIDCIFQAHENYLDLDSARKPSPAKSVDEKPQVALGPFGMHSPIQMGLSSLEGLGSAMQHLQHDPAFANAPDLPAEMLEKIGAIARIVVPDAPIELPEAQHNCNCPHCQIARAIGGQTTNSIAKQEPEPMVSPEELHFKQWEIAQTGDKLFQVTNRLDTKEVYQVYLGNPVGCTCGQAGCEHIPAVLRD